jgi:cobalt/nickel transport system permease protein
MSGAHSHALYVHGHSLIHRLAPECKLAAQLLLVLIIVATPREVFWAFGLYAGVVTGLIAVARIPPGFVLRRMVFEVPFVLFAALMPFLGGGERTDVFGLSLSVAGLWGAWNILAKATLGVAISIVVAATTTMPEFVRGFERLHLPRVLVSMSSFMVRYFDVIADEMRRMKVARESRGYDPRWIWQARAVAISAGALFIRAYERGERVYLSMLARGYEGAMPSVDQVSATPRMWVSTMLVPAAAAVVMISAWMVT